MNEAAHGSILLVGDDPHLLTTLADCLAFEGFDVHTAQSAEDGLAKLRIAPADLIILDDGLPGIGAGGFLRRIAAADGRPAYPVLALTDGPATRHGRDDLDARAILEKPCDEADLLKAIRDILSTRSALDLRSAGTLMRTVLLGEDREPVAQSLGTAICNAGYVLLRAGTGPQVLEKAIVSQPDIVVLRRGIARMNGNLIVSALEEMPRTRIIPIVLYESAGSPSGDPAPGSPSRSLRLVLDTEEPERIVPAVRSLLAGV